MTSNTNKAILNLITMDMLYCYEDNGLIIYSFTKPIVARETFQRISIDSDICSYISDKDSSILTINVST